MHRAHGGLQGRAGTAAAKAVQHQPVQERGQGYVRMQGQGIAQPQRAVRGQLRDQALGQGLEGFHLLVALLAGTIWFTPYGKSTPANAQIVDVTAQQFYWKLSRGSVQADRPVAFVTRSTDVNHGFAIFRGHVFIAQIQVVPGSTSTLVQTFL